MGLVADAGALLDNDAKAVRFANAHLSDDKAVAKMGHPVLWLKGQTTLYCSVASYIDGIGPGS